MRKCVLVVAQEMDLRAKIARWLQLSGCAVELATEECRALRLASGQRINAAIVAPGSSFAGLAMARKLRDTVPKILVLAETNEDIGRFSRSLPEADAFLLKSCSEEELVGRLAELMAPSKAEGDTAPVPIVLRIEDRKLDLAARLFIDAEGRELLLTRAECALLRELANSPGRLGRAMNCVTPLRGVALILVNAASTCSSLGYGRRSNQTRRIRDSS